MVFFSSTIFSPSYPFMLRRTVRKISKDTRLTQTSVYKYRRAAVCVVGLKVSLLTASRIQQAMSQTGKTGNHKRQCLQRATLSSNFASGNHQRKFTPSLFLFNKPILQGVSFARYSSTTLRNPRWKFTWDLTATCNVKRTSHTLVTYMCRWGHFPSLVTSQHSRLQRILL